MCVSSQTSIISADFQRLSKVLKKFSPLCGDNAHSAKSFVKRSSSKGISSCQQHIKLDQFSQQNTHCRTNFFAEQLVGCSSSFSNRILICRLTLQWREMNLIGQFFWLFYREMPSVIDFEPNLLPKMDLKVVLSCLKSAFANLSKSFL